jgi:hypothetical protein
MQRLRVLLLLQFHPVPLGTLGCMAASAATCDNAGHSSDHGQRQFSHHRSSMLLSIAAKTILAEIRCCSSCCWKRKLADIVCLFQNRYWKFESSPLHHPVSRYQHTSENRLKSARVRAILRLHMDLENGSGDAVGLEQAVRGWGDGLQWGAEKG